MKATQQPTVMCDPTLLSGELAPHLNPLADPTRPALVDQYPTRFEVLLLEDLIAPGLSTIPGLVSNHNEATLSDEVVLTTQPLEEVIAPAMSATTRTARVERARLLWLA